MGRCCMIVKGSVVRLLFAALAGLCVWLISDRDGRLWLMLVAFLILLFVEGAYTLGAKKHGSWKWFSPTVALLLLCTVPCLWIIEWDIYQTRRECERARLQNCDQGMFNSTSLPPIFGFQVSMELTLPDWSLVLHQQLLFALILGRWLLPKGELSRDQLSQLLLVQIGMAADILEFITEGLKVEGIYGDNLHAVILLSVWTCSLPQFTLSLTLTKDRKRRVAGTEPLAVESTKAKRLKHGRGNADCCHIFCGTEVWAILVAVTMQDLPFLGTRLYLIFNPSVPLSIPFFFFTFKNALLATLQLYRLAVILHEYRKKRIARAKVSAAESSAPSETLELRDSMTAHPDPKLVPRGPVESTREDTTATVWFTSRFLQGFGGDHVRHRKHVGVQTEWSLHVTDDDFDQYPIIYHRYMSNVQQACSTVSLEKGSAITESLAVDSKVVCNFEFEKDNKEDAFIVHEENKMCGAKECKKVGENIDDGCIPNQSGFIGPAENNAKVGEKLRNTISNEGRNVHAGRIKDDGDLSGPGPDDRDHGDAVYSSDEGENIRKAVCEIIANVEGCCDRDDAGGGEEGCHGGGGGEGDGGGGGGS